MENQHHHRHQQHSSSYEYDYPILDHGNNYQLIDHNKRIGTFVQSKKMAINTIDDNDGDDDDDDRQQHQQKPPYDLNKQQDDGVKLKQQLYEQTNDGSKFDVTNQMHVTSNHLQTPIDDNDQNIKTVHKLVQQKVHQVGLLLLLFYFIFLLNCQIQFTICIITVIIIVTGKMIESNERFIIYRIIITTSTPSFFC